jgi:hypothetical protein
MDTAIPRLLEDTISKKLAAGKVTGIFGARRTGKTYLMKRIYRSLNPRDVLFLNGENLDDAEIISSRRLSVLRPYLKGYKYLFIDEAHKIPDAGLSLKLIVDSFQGLKILITGSAPLDLQEKVGEPLTGRNLYFNLYPFALKELNENKKLSYDSLPEKLIFGLYPEIVMAKNIRSKIDILESIKNGYLLKDVLSFDNQKNPVFIIKLLRLIAFQIGNDISYNELAMKLEVNRRTVMRYLDILEKVFILFSLRGYSNNLRKEYSKTPRYYFYDNGIRNIVINNFKPLSNRDDIGMLWENFVISERIKINNYKRKLTDYYFWRTYDKKEIDFIEERNGMLRGFEIKWKQNRYSKPVDFLNAYKNSKIELINNSNYLDYLL